jgi:hypothetical protein
LHSAQRECGAAEFREGMSFPPGGGMPLVDHGAGGVVVMTPCWERAEEGGAKYYNTTLKGRN